MIKTEGIKFCPFCGKRHPASCFQQKSFKCPLCKNTFYPRPAPAVAAIIIKNQKVFLVKRNIQPFKGRWSLPSGFVEYGENPLFSLKKELKEELGIQPIRPKLLTIKLGRDYPGKYILGIYYLVNRYKNDIRLLSDENKELKWFDFNNIPAIPFSQDDKILKKVTKEIAERNNS